MRAIIVDLDGTLFDNRHRSHLIPDDINDQQSWAKFNQACLLDTPNEERINWVRALVMACLGNYRLMFLTSRGDHSSFETRSQLANHFLGYRYQLMMRTPDDLESSVEFKRRKLTELYKYDPYTHSVFVDDNRDICTMVRREFPQINVIEVETMDCTLL